MLVRKSIFSFLFLLLLVGCNSPTENSVKKNVNIVKTNPDIQQLVDKTVIFAECTSIRETEETERQPEPHDKYIKLLGAPNVVSDGRFSVVDLDFSTLPYPTWKTMAAGFLIGLHRRYTTEDAYEYQKVNKIINANVVHMTIKYETDSSQGKKKNIIVWAYFVFRDDKNKSTTTSIPTIYDDDATARAWVERCKKYAE